MTTHTIAWSPAGMWRVRGTPVPAWKVSTPRGATALLMSKVSLSGSFRFLAGKTCVRQYCQVVSPHSMCHVHLQAGRSGSYPFKGKMFSSPQGTNEIWGPLILLSNWHFPEEQLPSPPFSAELRMVQSYLRSPIRLHGFVPNLLSKVKVLHVKETDILI